MVLHSTNNAAVHPLELGPSTIVRIVSAAAEFDIVLMLILINVYNLTEKWLKTQKDASTAKKY